MSIEDIKKALAEVKEICDHCTCCEDCPFDVVYKSSCRFAGHSPLSWKIDDWEDEQV